ncbi:hypothetical protein NLN44_23350, partial [Escherichia coli]|nr:hypothetical protein [Escherichia coli]
EWVHVQLHQQKGMISLSPPTICNSAPAITSGGRAADWKTGSFGPYGCPENLSVRFFPNSAGSPLRFWQAVASSGLPMNMVIREKPYQLMVALIALYTAIPVVTIVILSGQQSHKLELIAVHFITFITMVFVLRRKMGKRWLDLFEEKLAIYKPNDKLALSELHESIREKNGLDLQDLQDWYWKEKMTYAYHKEHKTTISYQKFK